MRDARAGAERDLRFDCGGGWYLAGAIPDVESQHQSFLQVRLGVSVLELVCVADDRMLQ